jgi:tetratricopeptide (TPR) repeat protein
MARARAEAARLQGNDAMRSRDFGTAFDCYSVALQSMARDHLVLGNRSQAALKLGHHALALQDAEQAIQCGPTDWHKGHYRRGMVFLETGNYQFAVGCFAEAALRAPDDRVGAECKALCLRSEAALKAQTAEEQLMPCIGAAVGLAVTLLLLALGAARGQELMGKVVLALILVVAGVGIGGTIGYLYAHHKKTTREGKLTKVTAVVEGPVSTKKGKGAAAAATAATAQGAAVGGGGGGGGDSGDGGGGGRKVRKRTTVREAAIKAKAKAKAKQ